MGGTILGGVDFAGVNAGSLDLVRVAGDTGVGIGRRWMIQGEIKSVQHRGHRVTQGSKISCHTPNDCDLRHIGESKSRIQSRPMKSAIYRKAAPGKVLEIQEVERPVPKDSEVLIRVCAASVNPLDWRMKSQRPGVDVAGEVVATGRNVTEFKEGDAVFGIGRGVFAEYACASEAKIARKPAEVSFEQAAAIPVAGLTALQGLRDKGRLRPGQKVLINGAAGGVGTFAVQIAKQLGGNVTGVCSTRNVELVRSLGADRVIDYTREDFTRDSERYDLILDNAASRTLQEMRGILNANGKCVIAGAPKTLWSVASRIVKARVCSIFWKQKFRFFIAKMRREDLTTLGELTSARKLTVVIERKYPLHEAAAALAYLEEGHAKGKVVITVGQ